MSGPLAVGIDIGTSSVKALAVEKRGLVDDEEFRALVASLSTQPVPR